MQFQSFYSDSLGKERTSPLPMIIALSNFYTFKCTTGMIIETDLKRVKF